MKLIKSCKFIQYSECPYYIDCMEYEIKIEIKKGKLSYGQVDIQTIVL